MEDDKIRVERFLRREAQFINDAKEHARKICQQVFETPKGREIVEAERIRLKTRRMLSKQAMKALSKEDQMIQKLRNTFEIYDVDCKDAIDCEEFRQILKDLCIPISANVSSEFREIDREGRGAISFDSFHRWYTSKGNAYSRSNQLLKWRLRVQKSTKSLNGQLDQARAKRALIASALKSREIEARETFRQKHYDEFKTLSIFDATPRKVVDTARSDTMHDQNIVDGNDAAPGVLGNDRSAASGDSAMLSTAETKKNSQDHLHDSPTLEEPLPGTLEMDNDGGEGGVVASGDSVMPSAATRRHLKHTDDVPKMVTASSKLPSTRMISTPVALKNSREKATKTFNDRLRTLGVSDASTTDFATKLLKDTTNDLTDTTAIIETFKEIAAEEEEPPRKTDAPPDEDSAMIFQEKLRITREFASLLPYPLMFSEYLDSI